MAGQYNVPSLGGQMAMSGGWNATQNRDPSRKRLLASPWLPPLNVAKIGEDIAMDQWETQSRVTHSFRLRVAKFPNATADAARHSPIWINKGPTSSNPMSATSVTDRRQHGMVTHFLNYFLAMRTFRDDSPEAPMTDPEWVRANFSFAGILHSDKNDNLYSSGERGVVVDRQHVFCEVSNLWAGALPQDHLWFVVKFEKVPFSRAYEVTSGNAQHVTMERADRRPTKYPGYVVQVSALCTRTAVVPRSALTTVIEYPDGTKKLDVGYACRVGRCAENNHQEPFDPESAMRSATQLARQPFITVILRV